ncbi:hypothetical protein GQ53DRAFT_186484 [Thozetella sp. PMI_491]|nr:hypothetical protein GQ53DRAFT_186484 [Thozetella sp. PMI_491]
MVISSCWAVDRLAIALDCWAAGSLRRGPGRCSACFWHVQCGLLRRGSGLCGQLAILGGSLLGMCGTMEFMISKEYRAIDMG